MSFASRSEYSKLLKSLEIQSYLKNNSCEFCLLGALLPEPGGNRFFMDTKAPHWAHKPFGWRIRALTASSARTCSYRLVPVYRSIVEPSHHAALLR